MGTRPSRRGKRWLERAAVLLGVFVAAISTPVRAQPAADGQWEAPTGPTGAQWGRLTMHAIHDPCGKILVWDTPGNLAHPRLWDPGMEDFTLEEYTYYGGNPPVPFTDDISCSGHAPLSSGAILVVGGSGTSCHSGATNQVKRFQGTWTSLNGMYKVRWYPTATRLGDSRILVCGGDDSVRLVYDEEGNIIDIIYGEIDGECDGAGPPEIYDPRAKPGSVLEWQLLTDASLFLDEGAALQTYPFMFLLPGGVPPQYPPPPGAPDPRVFYAGGQADQRTYVLDVASQTWTFVDSSNTPRDKGSAVMYRPGKVLMCGGFYSPETFNSTEKIDLTQGIGAAQWVQLPTWNMNRLRHGHNLVVTPIGWVIAIGGHQGPGFEVNPNYNVEWIDPNDPLAEWDLLAEMPTEPEDLQFAKGYHSVAVLMLDGRILCAGGDGEPNAVIYAPPYLFSSSPRPTIASSPATATYGSTFTITLSDARPPSPPVPAQQIDKVTLVALAADTHGFDQNQRYLELIHTVVDSNTLSVTAPPDGSWAPPGHYMLFVVSDLPTLLYKGVPSQGEYIQLVSAGGAVADP